MSKHSNRYTIEDVKLWAEKYKETLLLVKVAKEFDVNRDTVMKWLKHYKEDFDIQFKDEVFDNMYDDGFKICSKCGEKKELDKFFKSYTRGRGCGSACKDCTAGSKWKLQQEQKNLVSAGFKKCVGKYGCGQVKILNDFHHSSKTKDGYFHTCKECIKKARNIVRGKRVVPVSTQLKKCTGKYGCGEIKPLSDFDYNKPEKRYISHCKDCRTKRHKNNIQARLAANLRSRIRSAIKNGQKVGSAVRDLGCSIQELKNILEIKFYPNPETGEEMSWENYSYCGWHVDHIVPLSFFDLSNREQFLKACHYANLQPLWAKENFMKSANIL